MLFASSAAQLIAGHCKFIERLENSGIDQKASKRVQITGKFGTHSYIWGGRTEKNPPKIRSKSMKSFI